MPGCAIPFYGIVLSFGNVVTTIIASLAVANMPSVLSSYYFVLSAFFGVFAFEAVLKNTNITMFDKGVLTIQSWIDKALNAAAAAVIDRQGNLKRSEETQLVGKLMEWTEKDINTRVFAGKVESLDADARASSADAKLYKVFQLVTMLADGERRALLAGAYRKGDGTASGSSGSAEAAPAPKPSAPA